VRPVTVSLTGSPLNSAVIPLDIYANPTSVDIDVIVSGTITYSVQYTADDPFAPTFNPATANWFNHPNLTALSVSADGNFAFPPRAVWLITTAGSGTATMRIIQAGTNG
jgi:hypothetical protein